MNFLQFCEVVGCIVLDFDFHKQYCLEVCVASVGLQHSATGMNGFFDSRELHAFGSGNELFLVRALTVDGACEGEVVVGFEDNVVVSSLDDALGYGEVACFFCQLDDVRRGGRHP